MKNTWGNPSNIIKNQKPTKYAFNLNEIFVDTERILSKREFGKCQKLQFVIIWDLYLVHI